LKLGSNIDDDEAPMVVMTEDGVKIDDETKRRLLKEGLGGKLKPQEAQRVRKNI
jgi:hypothetical protein